MIGVLLWIFMEAIPASSTAHDRVAAASPAWSDLVASMDGMHAAMVSVETSSDSDEDFVRLMLPHHQAAIDMARAQLLYGTDPQIRRLAQEIITDQQLEIQVMRLWLNRNPPAPRRPDDRFESRAVQEEKP